MSNMRIGLAALLVAGFLVQAAVGQVVPIYEVQGRDDSSPLDDRVVTVRGVVTGDFQLEDQLAGFFVQEPEGDGDSATSDGLFVQHGSTEVSRGDLVEVTGEVDEHFSLTLLTDIESLTVVGKAPLPAPARLPLPVADTSVFERYEGMLVTVSADSGPLAVTETYHLGRGGLVTLADDVLLQFTEFREPSVEGYRAYQETLALRSLVLDDGSLVQNPDPIVHSSRGEELTARQPLRIGDTVPAVTGLLTYSFSGWRGTDAYRIHPTAPVRFDSSNPRPSGPPPVGGRLRVASFNVLNYFNGDGRGGGFPTSRGAENPEEFRRQTEKLMSAMLALNAEVMALIEIENDRAGSESAVADLVEALNQRTMPGTYRYVETGRIGGDEIKVALAYRPSAVVPVGGYRVLNSSVENEAFDLDERYEDELNRPALAQTFEEVATGERFTVIVNHLKSKGSTCSAYADPIRGDGQGNCNGVRTSAAEALADWAAVLAEEVGDPDVLILGDLNAYLMEDPVQALLAKGFRNLLARGSYSYVFFGQSGTLDHALATPALAAQVTGAVSWDINTDEPPVLDYNVNYKSDRQVDLLYSDSPFRSSDHDPVVVGLELEANAAAPEPAGREY